LLALIVHRCPVDGVLEHRKVGQARGLIPISRRWSSHRFLYGYLVTT